MEFSEEVSKKINLYKAIYILFVFFVVFSIIYSLILGRNMIREKSFETETKYHSETVNNNFYNHLDSINFLIAFLNSSFQVTENEWWSYVNKVFSGYNNSPFGGIGYLEIASVYERKDFILDNGIGDINFYLKHSYPSGNQLSKEALFSIDLRNDINIAVKSGKPRVVHTLVSDITNDEFDVFIFLAPVYSQQKELITPKNREENIAGVVYSTLDYNQLFNLVYRDSKTGQVISKPFYLDVLDKADDKTVFSNYNKKDSGPYFSSYSLNLLGENWLLKYNSREGYKFNGENDTPIVIAIIALVFIILGSISIKVFFSRIDKGSSLNTLMDGYVHTQIELRKQNKELKKSYEKLRELDNIKDHFISMVSHELRTPLTVIKGYISLFLKGKIGKVDTSQKEYFDRMSVNVEYLLGIINDTLDLSKLEAGRIDFTYKKVNIYKDIDAIVKEFKDECSRKGNLITFVGSNLEVETDTTRVRQVLTNLISNANKFTEKGKIIVSLSLNEKQTKFQVSVKDNGIGIKQENIGKLFKKFTQIDPDYKRENKGTGLGLCICKLLVEAMGGKIRVESKYESGTTFSFSLPVNM